MHKDEYKLLELSLHKSNLEVTALKEALKKESKQVKSLQKELKQTKESNSKLKEDCYNTKVELESTLKALVDNKAQFEGATAKYHKAVEDFNQRSEHQLNLSEKVTSLFQLMTSACEGGERSEADEWLSTHSINKDGRSIEPLTTDKMAVLVHATR